MSRAILLTGNPGCGKTTLIRKVLARYPGLKGGFYTQEIRQGGLRKGFELITLDGKNALLAHVELHGPHRIGKYGVDVSVLDSIAAPAIQAATWQALSGKGIVVVDEIGPMEILSAKFRRAVEQALDSEVTLLGTLVRRSTPFTDQLRARQGIQVIEVRADNRDELEDLIFGLLAESKREVP